MAVARAPQSKRVDLVIPILQMAAPKVMSTTQMIATSAMGGLTYATCHSVRMD